MTTTKTTTITTITLEELEDRLLSLREELDSLGSWTPYNRFFDPAEEEEYLLEMICLCEAKIKTLK